MRRHARSERPELPQRVRTLVQVRVWDVWHGRRTTSACARALSSRAGCPCGCGDLRRRSGLRGVRVVACRAKVCAITHDSDRPRHAGERRGQQGRAEAEAAQLLAEVRLPAGAGEIATPPAALHGMQEGLSSTAALIDKPRFWRVPLSVDAALAWIRAHPPAGLTLGGSLSETGPGVYTRGIVFTDRDTAAWQ
jgi:hypothetical protein